MLAEIARLNMTMCMLGGDGDEDYGTFTYASDMELRDHFAGLALQGLLAKYGCKTDKGTARFAYEIADAMMEARDNEDN